jgi:hypothetical protein
MASQALKRIALVVFMLFSSAGMAQTAADSLAGCKKIKDNTQRLACFDKIQTGEIVKSASPNPVSGQYSAMSYDDFKTDLTSLVGKKVSVKGVLTYYDLVAGGVTYATLMKDANYNSGALIVSIDKLAREDRKKIMNNCLPPFCPGTFYGTVINDSNLGTSSLMLDKIVWK